MNTHQHSHTIRCIMTYFLSSRQDRQCIERTTKGSKSVGAFRGNERFHVRCPSERDLGPNLEGIAESVRGLVAVNFTIVSR